MNIKTFSTLAAAFAFALAVPVVAVDNASSTPNGRRNPPMMQMQRMNENRGERQEARREGGAASVVDVTCAKAAVSTRGQAVSTAFTTHTTTVSALITAHTAAQQAAFDLTGRERQKAMRTANQTLNKGRMESRKALMTAQRTAQTTFKTAMQACGVKAADVDKGEPVVE